MTRNAHNSLPLYRYDDSRDPDRTREEFERGLYTAPREKS